MGARGDKLSLEGWGMENVQIPVAEEQAHSPFSPILRSKGFLFLDANPGVAFYWSHAGKSVSFSMRGQWSEGESPVEGGLGAPRTELVFIGSQYDEGAIRKLLESCVVE